PSTTASLLSPYARPPTDIPRRALQPTARLVAQGVEKKFVHHSSEAAMNLPRLTGRGLSIARGDDPHALALERANGAFLLQRVHQQYLERPRHRGGKHLLVRRSRDPELLRRYIDLPKSFR